MLDRLIGRFSVWFSSSGAVWQTTVAVLVWVAVEAARPVLDPHGFVLLYILTVYSAITQPALAYASNVAASEAARTAELQRRLLANQLTTMRAVLAILERLEPVVEDIAEAHGAEVDDIAELHDLEGSSVDAPTGTGGP